MGTHHLSSWIVVCAAVAVTGHDAFTQQTLFAKLRNQLSVSASTNGKILAGAKGPRVGIVLPEDENEDAWVTEVVENSPAAMAGVKAGDTITKLDGKTIKTAKQFREAIKAHKAGDEVKFTVRRETKTVVLTVTLGKDTDS